jgi:hypothetical protein
MDRITREEAFHITTELCTRYDISLRGVSFRRKKGAMGTAYTKEGKIIYSTLLLRESRWQALKTICHEAAHLLAAKRYGKNCLHDSRFHDCEAEIDAIYGFRPVYAAKRGYAAAYFDIASGKSLDCRRGYRVDNGTVVIDRDRKANDMILRKVMKAAFFAKAFIKGEVYAKMRCEPVEGRLALTVEACNDIKTGSREVIYLSELKKDNFSMNLKNVKYSGRALRYNVEDFKGS